MKKIIFFGTSDFGIESMYEIIKKYNLIAVVTNPDKKTGRGMKITKTKIKIIAEQNNIKVFQPSDLNNTDFINSLKKLNPDLFIVIAFKKLPESIWKIPAYGTFNLHASLLPKYRGAAPINWAIINGETVTGLTTFFINDKIDAGDIIMKKNCKIELNDSFENVYNKMIKISPEIISETIDKIFKGNLKTINQFYENNEFKAPKFFKNDLIIDWKKECKEIYDFIRAFSPKPGSRTTLLIKKKNNLIFEQPLIITKVSNFCFTNNKDIDEKYKLYFDHEKNNIFIENFSGKFIVEKIKLPNKNEIDSISFFNGFLNKKENIGDYYFN